MYINSLNCSYVTPNKYNNKQRNFEGLIKDKSALPIIKNLSSEDKFEFNRIEKRLSKTKFWDMKIYGQGKNFKEFKFEFLEKKNKSGIITNGIYPYNKNDNEIKIYSIIYGPENISDNVIKTLRYKSKKRADELYEKYLQILEQLKFKCFKLSPIESLKNKEFELKMLEEAAHYAKKCDKSDLVNTGITTKSSIGNNLKE